MNLILNERISLQIFRLFLRAEYPSVRTVPN